jgi:hypothetical protein
MVQMLSNTADQGWCHSMLRAFKNPISGGMLDVIVVNACPCLAHAVPAGIMKCP